SRAVRTRRPGPSTRRWPTSMPSAAGCLTRPAWTRCCARATGSWRSASSSPSPRRGRPGRYPVAEAWAWLKSRLANRPDSEHAQALVRIALILVILVYVLLPSSRADLSPGQYRDVLAIVLTGLLLSLGIFSALLARPGRSDLRRWVGMLADYGLMAAGMIRMGEPLAWVYVVVMWVTVGNGLRYGNRYLALAVCMAVACFGSVLVMTEFWHEVRGLGVGLLVGLVAIPMYLSSLLRQLTRATEEAQRA